MPYTYNINADAYSKYNTSDSSSLTATYVLDDISADKNIYNSRNTYGNLWFRNSYSSTISPASAALSAIYVKYTGDIKNELETKLKHFDVIYDIILFETEHYIVIDKIDYDFETGEVISNTVNKNVIPIQTSYTSGTSAAELSAWEKFAGSWFHEDKNEIILGKTTLANAPELSATDDKIIYPELWKLNMDDVLLEKIFPRKNLDVTSNTQQQPVFDNLFVYSLSSNTHLLTGGQFIDIIEIEDPVMTYSENANKYKMTFIGFDPQELPYIFDYEFKFNTENEFVSAGVNLYKTNKSPVSINFANRGSGFNAITDRNSLVAFGSTTLDAYGAQYIYGTIK